jgi:putative MATE family efflux protein
MPDVPATQSAEPRRGGADLTVGPIGRTLLMFSLPILGTNIVQALSGSINAVWVGKLLGERALTATSNANLVLFLMMAVVIGVGVAATILIGQSMGMRNPDQARRVVGTGATFFLGAAVLLALAGYAMTPTILGWMGTPHDARPLAQDYLRIIFAALPFIYFLTFLGMVLRGSGDSRTPFLFMILSAVLDGALNPLLILGVGPLPTLGIAGSAAATLIAQGITILALLLWVYAKKYDLRLTGPTLAYLRPDWRLLKSLVTKGTPMGLQMLVISGSAIVLISLVNAFGSETSAAFGVSSQLWAYLQMPAMAVGAACSSMAAQNVGAGRWDRVDGIALSGIWLNVAMTGVLIVILYFVDRSALGLFLPSGSPSIEIAVRINLIVSWSFIPFGIMMVLFGVVRATGAVMPALVILFFSLVVIRLPFAELLVDSWGADAIWWSLSLGFVVSMILSLGYYRFGGWRNARMLAPVAHAEA